MKRATELRAAEVVLRGAAHALDFLADTIATTIDSGDPDPPDPPPPPEPPEGDPPPPPPDPPPPAAFLDLCRGPGVNVYDTRGNSRWMWERDRQACVDEVVARGRWAADAGASWVRLCLQSDTRDTGDRVSHRPGFGFYDRDLAYREETVTVVARLRDLGLGVLVCPWQDPGVVGGLPLGAHLESLRDLATTLGDDPGVAFDPVNEPEGLNVGDDELDRRAALLRGCAHAIWDVRPRALVTLPGLQSWSRDAEAWLSSHRHDGLDGPWALKQHVYDEVPGPRSDSLGRVLDDAAAAGARAVLVGEYGPTTGYMSPNDVGHLWELLVHEGQADELAVGWAAWGLSGREGSDPLRVWEDDQPGGFGLAERGALTEWGERLRSHLRAHGQAFPF